MILPVKPDGDIPANFRFWTTLDLGRSPVVARAACMRALLTFVKNFSLTDPLDRAAGFVSTIKSLPSDWKWGFPPEGVTRDPIVQDALGDLGYDPEWRDNVAGFIRRGRYGQAMGTGQYLDLVPILLPRREMSAERLARLQEIIAAFRVHVPGAQEAVVARLVDWAMTTLLATPQGSARAAPEGSEWVFESSSIYESMERMGDLTVRLMYPQVDFPDSLVGEERLDFLYEMHGRIAQKFERTDGRALLVLAVGLWRKVAGGHVEYRPLLAVISPVLPLDYYIADLERFVVRGQALDERIAFYRAIQDLRGEPVTDEETLRAQLLQDDIFYFRWGPGGNDTRDSGTITELGKKLGIRY